MIEIEISTEYIKLDQFLKLTNIAQTGGHAKIIIGEGIVEVNGEQCIQRGRKLKEGDTVEVEDHDKFIIV